MRWKALSSLASAFALGLSVAPATAQETTAPLAERTRQSGLPLTDAQKSFTLPHLSLALRVYPDRKSISGTADYTVQPKTAPVSTVEFDLDPRYAISAVRVDGVALTADRWANDGGLLTISLPEPRSPDSGSFQVAIGYAGHPHVAVRAPWDGGFVWSQMPEGAPWVATAVQGEGCDLFWPCIDHSAVEIAVVDTAITVPKPLVAAGNGTLQGTDDNGATRTYRWRAKTPNSYGIALNIAPYEQISDQYRSRFGNIIPLEFWHLPGNRDKARRLLDEMPDFLDFFESLIGPYPFGDEKVGIAETPHLGMEHQTINAYGNGYRPSAEGYDWLMHHEFAHEWFANQLTNANYDDMWLHEGFGAYMQPLYLRWKDGELAYHAALWGQRQSIMNQRPIVSGEPKTEKQVYDPALGPGQDIYVKGSWVLHTLRELIGDDAFFRATTRLVYGRPDPRPGNFAPRLGTTVEFETIVEDETRREMDWFFDAYLRSAALPELIESRDGATLRLEWSTPSDGAFPMPVEIRAGNRIHTLAMANGSGTIDLGDASAHYTIDPHGKILRRDRDIERYQQWASEQQAGAH